MAHHHHHYHGMGGQPHPEHELWFDMQRSHHDEPSAYRSTVNQRTANWDSSLSTNPYSGIPSISTTADTNKPLPPSPPGSERKKRKSGLRSMLGRPSSGLLDPNHLRPEPHNSAQRHSATSANLTINTHGQYHHAYSRSMPSSPFEYHQASTSPDPSTITRAHSSAADYPDTMSYQPYASNPYTQTRTDSPSARAMRSSSRNNYFESSPSRAHTFHSESSSSSTMRESISTRPRPHTWLSPTDSFSDASQYHLFVEATTGLPSDGDAFSTNGPPQLQGSLFARRTTNDTIPIPLQHTSASTSSRANMRSDWQYYEPPSTSSRSVSSPISHRSRSERYPQHRDSAHIAAVNRELELLGLEDDDVPDDELPDYAQSQAEANAKKRQAASARARELEAQWRSTRGR